MRRCYLNKRKLKKVLKKNFAKCDATLLLEISERYKGLDKYVGCAGNGFPICLDKYIEYLSVPKQFHKYIGKRT